MRTRTLTKDLEIPRLQIACKFINHIKITGTDYVYFHRSGFGIQPGGTIRGTRGWNGGDYRESLKDISYPEL